MNINGFTNDNLHQGDVRITGDLQVDGDMEIKGDVLYTGDVKIQAPSCLETDCIKSFTPATGIEINTEYKLPVVKGAADQVLTQIDAAGNTEFRDLTAGTARVVVNKFTALTTNNTNDFGNFRVIENTSVGTKDFNASEWTIGSEIRIKVVGYWNYQRADFLTIPTGIFGLRVNNAALPQDLYNVEATSAYAGPTFPQTVNSEGYFNMDVSLVKLTENQYNFRANIANSRQTGNTFTVTSIITPEKLGVHPITFSGAIADPFTVSIEWQDNTSQSAGLSYLRPSINRYEIDLVSAGTSILATSETLTTDHLLLSNINGGAQGDGGHINLFDKRGIKPMTGNINMDNNSITNLQTIDVGGGTLNIANTGFPAMNITGGVNFNNTGFIYQCPSVFAGSGNLDIGSDFGVINIQTGPFGSRQTEIAIIPNLINVNSPITNFVGGDVYLSQNRIQDVSAIDDGANNSINMRDAGFGNAININSVGAGVNLQEQSTGNRIGVNTTGLASQVLSGGTIIQNSDAVNNLTLSKTNGGQIFLQNIGAGGAITGEAEQIDFNYTTTNFKVRNGLTNNFVIEPTQVESFLNFVCPSINGISPVGGIFAGTADSLVYNPSIDGAIEKSIMPTSIVGSLTVPANGFSVGDSFHLVLAGDFNSNNGDTLNIRLYGGPTSAVLLANLPVPLTASSGVSFEVECDFQLRIIGGPGVADICSNFDFTYNGGAGSNFRGERGVFQNNTTFSTLTDNILLVTAQYSTTNANNSMKTIVSKLSKTY